MKRIVVLLAFVLFSVAAFGQYVTNSMNFDGQTRQYSIYVPNSYNAANPASLVFGLHGLGDNIGNFSGIGLHLFADTANFIIVLPQALVDPLIGSSAWNSGASAFGITLNGNVNDVGFIEALIDSVSGQYAINPNRIYACGFSMGGFMSQRLACELNDKIAAIASVAGTIGTNLNCQPGRAVPVLHFHGTADATVSYSGNNFGMSTEPMMDFWATNNNCTTGPDTTAVPDIANDGFTIDHFEWSGCDQNFGLEFYKVNGADHIWLGQGNDIFYTREIWRFFSQYQHPNGAVAVAQPILETEAQVFPNPNNGAFSLNVELLKAGKVDWKLVDLQGRTLKLGGFNGMVGENQIEIDLEAASGMYVLKVLGRNWQATKRIIVQ